MIFKFYEESNLHEVSLNLLHYGYPNLSNESNTRIFESVHKYNVHTEDKVF